MGWKGTVRSVSAAMRAAERDAERRRKTEHKAQEADAAWDAVRAWKAHLRNIVNVHANRADDIDWMSLRNRAEPLAPQKSVEQELAAQAALSDFMPRFWDFLSGGSDKRRESLENQLVEARLKDSRSYAVEEDEFQRKLTEFQSDRDLASRVLDGDATAYRDVLTELYSGAEDLLGKTVTFHIEDSKIHVIGHVGDAEAIVPRFRRKQLASGKLSETKMPKGEFNELYQDYVCSVALRLAGDIFGVLPVNDCHVTACTTMLDSSTGHLSKTPILSVFFVRPTYEGLNLANLDPSDSMANFVHTMAFKKTRGFQSIKPLRKMD